MGRIERGENNVAILTILRIADAVGIKASDVLRTAAL